jgi:hypothetical protein
MTHKARWCILAILVTSFAIWPSSVLRADGGSVRLSARKGPYLITVFTSPTPFRAGLVDISVLVQDGATKEPIRGARVSTKATLLSQADSASIYQTATTEAATNKLFYAADFELIQPGWYSMEVFVEGAPGEAQVGFDLEVAEPVPRYSALWLWIGWPVLPILLFGVHQILIRRQSCSRRVE